MKKLTTTPTKLVRGGWTCLRTPEFIAEVNSYMEEGYTKTQVAAIMECSVSTVGRCINNEAPKKPVKIVAQEVKLPTNTVVQEVQAPTKAVVREVQVPTKTKPTNKQTSSFKFFWGVISYSKTTTLND